MAGTVMRSVKDKLLCAGVSGITVEITGADGSVFTMMTNASGNFFTGNQIAKPFTAKIRDAEGNERVMNTPQNETACASCHTLEGLNGAPGRIYAP